MELMKGYKQTEIGVIPDEWKLMTIDQIFEFHSTSNYSKAEMLPEGEIGCFHYGLIHSLPNNNYDIRTGVKYFITKQQAKYEFIRDGDVVMVDASEDLSGVNKSIEISDVEDKLFISGLHTYLLRDRGFFEKYFRGPILNAYFTKAQFYRLAVGMKVYGVSKQQLKTVLLPIPSKSEQTEIANALSDADTYITNLEKLLEKKRLIKQGAMQELLKPKDAWEIKKLGDITEIYTGKKNNQDKVFDGDYPFFVRSQTIERINSYSFDGEAILIPGEGNIGKIFHYINGKFDFHQRVYKISNFSKGYFGKYVYRYLSEYFGAHAMENSVKATVDSLRLPTFQNFQIPFPPSYEEQVTIAQILSDIDEELALLNLKLSKAKSIKQGMMQNLLTGKIRLI